MRAQEDLIRIKAALLKAGGLTGPQPLEASVPVVCSAVPNAIDLNLDPTRRNLVTIGGYNFDTVPAIQVFLVNGTQVIDETPNLHRTTHYEVTLNTGTNGIQVSSTSQKIVLKWKGQEISDIPVILSIPNCKTMMVSVPQQQVTIIPPLTHGDRDFGGHGPHVILNVFPSYSFAKASAIIDVTFVETNGNDTIAEGCGSNLPPNCGYPIYTPPTGFKIQSISDEVTTNWDYVHSLDNHVDTFAPGIGWVGQLQFSGFEGVNAVGSTAQALITFKELHVQIVQASGCQ